MDILSVILLTLILLWIIAAVIYLFRHHGSPCCGAGTCANHCKRCSHHKCPQRK